MNQFLIAIAITIIICCTSACAGGGSASEQAKADSLRADSLRRIEAETLRQSIADSLRADSLRRDSIYRDSIFEAHALQFSDFFRQGSPDIEFLRDEATLSALEAKGYEITERRQMRAAYDPNDPEGTDYPMATNYYLADGPDSIPSTTTITILNSEADRPITINFATDRQRDIFVSSLQENGFSQDHTGNLTHRSNTSWAGATATLSGRRIILEWIWTY